MIIVVVLVDSTYKINKKRFPPITLAVQISRPSKRSAIATAAGCSCAGLHHESSPDPGPKRAPLVQI